jgi:hypothetical protein
VPPGNDISLSLRRGFPFGMAESFRLMSRTRAANRAKDGLGRR